MKYACQGVTPPGTRGVKDVVVTNTDGGTATGTALFTYTAPVVISAPTVTAVTPTSGATSGSTPITITGTNFVAGATVTVGGAACTDVVVASATSITCVTPVGTAGAKDIVVTNTDGGTATGAGLFTYSAPLRSVTFKANGGAGLSYTLQAKSASKLSANKFTRSGFVFAGWNTKADGSGTAYKNQATFQFTADATLYAQWTVAKVSQRIAIFRGDDAKLSNDMKYTIRTWINKLPAGASITCEGSTEGLKVTALDKSLANNRAKNVCEYAKTIRKSLKYTLKTNPASANDMQARHVWMRLN